MVRHNEICDGIADLVDKNFNPVHVRDDPKIFTGPAVRAGKAKAECKRAPPQHEVERMGIS